MTPKINDPREVVNFAAGPATLPYDVLEEVQENLLDFNDTLISVTETSHRSKDFLKLVEETQDLLREILDIPEDYKILFAHGGASMQFANIAANFPGKQKYLVTGSFAKKAYQEAERMSEFAVGDRNPKAITNDNKPGEDKPDFSYIPSSDDIQNKIDSDSEYLHITDNNTIYGTTIFDVPDVNVPIIADMTSSLLSRKINVSDYAMIYAGFQKNLGPSGTALVLMNDELYNKLPEKKIPNMYSYKKLIDADSGYNTPSTFNIYVANEVLKWVK
jgi:phosphoserine aminotransferase